MEKNMLQHKLIKLIASFSRKEMSRLEEMARSPYHNKHKEVAALMGYLSEIYPHFDAKRCSRARLWRAIAPQLPLNQARLAVLFTYAWRLAETFLIIENDQLFEPEREQSLLQALRRKSQDDLFVSQLGKQEQSLASLHRKDSDHYFRYFKLADEADRFYVQAEHHHENDYLPRRQDYLDHFYLLEKLRDAVEMRVRRQILQGDYSARLLEAVLREVGDNLTAYADAPAILTYYTLYRMMEHPEHQRYQQALSTFQENEQAFSHEEIAGIYNYFQNYCIARINLDERAYLRELFQLYGEQLQRSLLLEEGFLPEWHYKNIVTVALRLRELDWARHFIQDYRKNLPPAVSENAYRFNLAAYYHACGDYGQVLPLLTQVEYSDVRYNIGAKALLLRTYYELGENEALFALVDSFRQYLKRNRLLADERRAGTYQLFRLTRRAAAIRAELPYTSADDAAQAIHRLKEDIKTAGAIFNRAWLEEKIADMETKLA